MATIVDQETDARFWAQTSYKPGQKLNPSDPTDAKMIPVWRDIHAKVQQESDAGKLVTTFDHPLVAANLKEALLADHAAVAHLEAAAATPDPAATQQHVAAAQAATEVVAQKTHEAATIQPASVSPQLSHEAAQEAKQEPPPPSAPAKEHVAHAQARAAHKHTPRSILDKETDARFWAQTHYKPGQKLDPNDKTDATMIPVWRDIHKKVKREDAAGRLVLTYNNPVVAQNISDAQVADKAAALHLEAAAASPQAASQNIAAAAVAAQVSAQKTSEAAQVQPPTVSPRLAHEAAQRVHKAIQRSDVRALLNHATYVQFWQSTRYKPGRMLNPRDPQDQRMIPTWRGIHAQVRQAYLASIAGQQPLSGRDHLAQEQAKGAGHRAARVHHHHARHRRAVRSTVHPRSLQNYREQAKRLAHEAEAGAPFVLVTQHPDGTPEHRALGSRAELDAEYAKVSEDHGQYKYVAAFDFAADPKGPVHDSVGIPAAEHVEEPAAPAPGPTEGGPPAAGPTEGGPAAGPTAPSPEGGPPSSSTAPSPEGGPSIPSALEPVPTPDEQPKAPIGKIALIAAAVAAAGGLVYAASRKTTKSRRRSHAPNVLVTEPVAQVLARPMRAR